MTTRMLAVSALSLALAAPALAQTTTTPGQPDKAPTAQNQATMQASGQSQTAQATGTSTTTPGSDQSAQAQTGPQTGGMQAGASQANGQSPLQIRESMTQDLEKAGFTDIQIMPEAYMVRAHDKAGRPVMMIVNPDSVLAVTELTKPGQSGNKTASTQ